MSIITWVCSKDRNLGARWGRFRYFKGRKRPRLRKQNGMRLLSWTLWGLLGVSQAVRLGAWSLPPAEGSGGAWLGGWSSYTLQGHPVLSVCPVGAALRCCSQGVLRHTHCASDSWSTQSSAVVLTLHITSASFTTLFLTALCLLICFSHIRLSVTPWSIACQAPLPMKISRQEYWNGLPFLLQIFLIWDEPVSLMSPVLAGGFFTISATWEAIQKWSSHHSFPLPSKGPLQGPSIQCSSKI